MDTANIANNAITSAKIADGAVTASKLGSDVGVWSTSSGHVYRMTGNVGIGTSTPTEALEVTSETTWATLASITYNSTMSPAMVGYRYRGTKASPTVVASGDYVFSNQGWMPQARSASVQFHQPTNLMSQETSMLQAVCVRQG